MPPETYWSSLKRSVDSSDWRYLPRPARSWAMSKWQQYGNDQGISLSPDLTDHAPRQIFLPMDPAVMAQIMTDTVYANLPSGLYLDFDPLQFLQYLPELEAEIFWLIYEKKKHQKDVAVLLGLSQPTVSYRFRRVLVKLSYLVRLTAVDVRALVNEIPFLKDREKDVLHDLFFYINQELVGRRYGMRQSSVKWIFLKTKRRLGQLEREEPDKWGHHFGLVLLLERNLGLRILQEEPDDS